MKDIVSLDPPDPKNNKTVSQTLGLGASPLIASFSM